MPVIEKATSYVRRISNRGLERVISELLDISEPHHDLAVTRYKDIGNWLDGDEQVASYNPQIYPQGSFLLGTVTKSISDEDDYDLDFVIELEQPGDEIVPRRLKRLVESAIETYVSNSSYLLSFQEEGQRCRTLDYSENVRFHMDVLPAIPATTTPYQKELNKLTDYRSAAIGQKLEAASNLSADAIAITDKPPDSWYVWLLSNPRGYAEWFRKMSIKNDPTLTRAMESAPKYRTKKSLLQRVVQILKRHRDIWIEKHHLYSKVDKPISIIITTLAAKAYESDVSDDETEILQVLQTVVENMLSYIEDEYYVWNPVNEHENLADNWQEHLQRKDCFYDWHEQVCNDLSHLNRALQQTYTTDAGIWIALTHFLGQKVVDEAREKSMLTIY